jgi:hypothetical protein
MWRRFIDMSDQEMLGWVRFYCELSRIFELLKSSLDRVSKNHNPARALLMQNFHARRMKGSNFNR